MASSKHINTTKVFSLNLAKPANNEAKCIQHLTLCNILLLKSVLFVVNTLNAITFHIRLQP